MYYFSFRIYNSRIQWKISKFITAKDNSNDHNSNEIKWGSSKFFLADVPS